MTEWQSISTAPRDGTAILVYEKWENRFKANKSDYYIQIAYWWDYEWRIDALVPPTGKYPTHWMPLPQPPKEDEQ